MYLNWTLVSIMQTYFKAHVKTMKYSIFFLQCQNHAIQLLLLFSKKSRISELFDTVASDSPEA